MKLSLASLGVLASLALATLSGCTHKTYDGNWTLTAGTVVTTDFTIEVNQIDEGAEDSTQYNYTYEACVVTSDHPEIVGLSRVASGTADAADSNQWLVWGKQPGNATLTLVTCDGSRRVNINVAVTAP